MKVIRTAVAVGAIGLLGFGGATIAASTGDEKPAPEASSSTSTVPVERRTLRRTQTFDAQLGYADSRTIQSSGAGTVTRLPDAGTVVDRGQALYAIDERPTYLMIGAFPAWRALHDDIDDGADIRQLEENLIALGHGGDDLGEADDEWDWRTRAAVKNWQRALGVPSADRDGRVELGEIRFEPAHVRIDAQEISTGDAVQPGAPLLSVTSDHPEVTVAVEVGTPAEIVVGTTVTVTLPNGTDTPGTITTVGTTAVGVDNDPAAAPTLTVTISLDDPAVAAGITSSPVEVSVVLEERTDVLAVPVEALIALPGGGYALDRPGDGTAPDDRVPVELGLFDDGWVEITSGELAEGDPVEVPR